MAVAPQLYLDRLGQGPCREDLLSSSSATACISKDKGVLLEDQSIPGITPCALVQLVGLCHSDTASTYNCACDCDQLVDMTRADVANTWI